MSRRFRLLRVLAKYSFIDRFRLRVSELVMRLGQPQQRSSLDRAIRRRIGNALVLLDRRSEISADRLLLNRALQLHCKVLRGDPHQQQRHDDARNR